VITRADLPRGVQAAQIAHAAGSAGRHPPGTYVVVLMVPDEISLRRLARKFEERDIAHELVTESDLPYDGQAMAIGCELVKDRSRIRKEVANLPLFR